MAVNVPRSLEARLEARVLMMSTNNILSPANGKPIIVPSQDIILGLYYLTLEIEGEAGEGMAVSTVGEIEHALHSKSVTLHSRVEARLELMSSEGKLEIKRVKTTPGRMKLAQILPKHQNVKFDLVNRLLTKKEVTNVIDMVYRHCGQKETVIFADRMMALGFKHACEAGIAFAKDDLVIPGPNTHLVADAQPKAKEYEQQSQDGRDSPRA